MARTIHTRRDLEQYGITVVTGESCPYSARTLCDVTERGRRIVFDLLGLPQATATEDGWNDAARSSIMVPNDLFGLLAVWCLILSGCREVLVAKDGLTIGLDGSEPERDAETRRVYVEMGWLDRIYAPVPGQPMVGTRSVHAMTGRWS